MISVVSPAKSLDYESPLTTKMHSLPDFLGDSEVLIKGLRKLSRKKIMDLMSVSSNIATLNHLRFSEWNVPFTTENARPAAMAFTGDVYVGLDAKSLSDEDLTFAQDKLRILSGLYGLLRPMDLMQAYRLEMGTRYPDKKRTKDLYAFWDMKITDALNALLKDEDEKVLVNLASNEYFKSLKVKAIEGEIITPVFKDYKNGDYKVISFFAKKARGMMARYIIENRIDTAEGLKGFDSDGYIFNEGMSKDKEWVFTRKQ